MEHKHKEDHLEIKTHYNHITILRKVQDVIFFLLETLSKCK